MASPPKQMRLDKIEGLLMKKEADRILLNEQRIVSEQLAADILVQNEMERKEKVTYVVQQKDGYTQRAAITEPQYQYHRTEPQYQYHRAYATLPGIQRIETRPVPVQDEQDELCTIL
ncbi:Hypothetical predicted protein [Paramuricea clavata]|uniref:Uncharacterized protein n=1 Tax=Paramuricea clavata TaxID=317549 RepID=A0A7D9HDF8_PARCT|nr:Hypothetical predicted protein [Paramuricea clavata]